MEQDGALLKRSDGTCTVEQCKSRADRAQYLKPDSNSLTAAQAPGWQKPLCGGGNYVTLSPQRVYFALSGLRPYRLAVRTPPFHGGGTGSIPVRVAKLCFSFSDGCNPLKTGLIASVPNSPS
jgi:hypothetical protein